MSTRYGWDPMDSGRAMSDSKKCISCQARFWPPKKVQLAEFCDNCWFHVEEGSCPHYGCGGDASLKQGDPIQTVQCDGQDFLVAHPFRLEAQEVPK